MDNLYTEMVLIENKVDFMRFSQVIGNKESKK